jgi:hypothetical protein
MAVLERTLGRPVITLADTTHDLGLGETGLHVVGRGIAFRRVQSLQVHRDQKTRLPPDPNAFQPCWK